MSLISQQPYTRLEIELEFVQCLANPFYLNFLAHSKVLDDERFVNYVVYLEYWRKPEYAKLLTYPVHSLAALTLLQQPQFRADIMNPGVAQEMLNDVVTSMNPETDPGPLPTNETVVQQQNGN
ncbi:SOH1-domain-containing protein [Morchella snyderi]|nr:SOH1-domain-containing protein [Morchella snyderi]